MESLDKERNWRESDFDFVQQNLRTILLKREQAPQANHYTATVTDEHMI